MLLFFHSMIQTLWGLLFVYFQKLLNRFVIGYKTILFLQLEGTRLQ